MYFESLRAAWEMAGHGPFVWSAYGITAVVVIALIGLPLQRVRQAEFALRAEWERQGANASESLAGESDAS